MRSGEIWLVNLDPTMGSEIRKSRPVVLVQGGHKKNLPLAIVVPVTGFKPAWAENPFFAVLDPTEINGLQKKSAVDCYQIRCLSHQRFIKLLGKITESQVSAIKTSLALILDIEEEHC